MDSDRKMKHELYSAALGQKWDEVLELFKKHPDVQATKVTTSEDTVLHVAISLGAPEEKVAKLIEEVKKTPEAAVETLAAKNNRYDTPLHSAASRGFTAICSRIIRGAHEASELVCRRNKDGETPLFLAALNGQTQTFLYLHGVCWEMDAIAKFGLLRRGNGDTVLHCAIQREYFGMYVNPFHLSFGAIYS